MPDGLKPGCRPDRSTNDRISSVAPMRSAHARATSVTRNARVNARAPRVSGAGAGEHRLRG